MIGLNFTGPTFDILMSLRADGITANRIDGEFLLCTSDSGHFSLFQSAVQRSGFYYYVFISQFLTNGDISKLTAQLAKKIGRVLLGLNPDDLDKLKLDNIDIIAALGKWKGWRKDQV